MPQSQPMTARRVTGIGAGSSKATAIPTAIAM
jgi:hypothetical protein